MLTPTEAEALGKDRSCDHTEWVGDRCDCEYAIEGKGCSVYENRPFVCRIFGAGKGFGMDCPLIPEQAKLSEAETGMMFLEFTAIAADEGMTDAANDVTFEAAARHEWKVGFKTEEQYKGIIAYYASIKERAAAKRTAAPTLD